jgi:hypothetical protein
MVLGRMWHRGHVPDDDTLTTESRRTHIHNRSLLTWLVAAAVALVIVGATLFALLGDDSDDNGEPSGLPSGDGAPNTVELLASPPTERCMLPNVEVLQQQELAFDGVVRSVAGGNATLEPSRFFAGDQADTVVVQAPDGDLQELLAAVDFREGERYLVSATDGRVTLCGFSGPYSDRLARLYDEAFGG